MKVRLKTNHAVTGFSNRFNTHGLGEMIVGFDEDDMDSCSISEYQVFLVLSPKGWVDMDQAFQDKDLIPDNFNQHFGEPRTFEERERGWSS